MKPMQCLPSTWFRLRFVDRLRPLPSLGLLLLAATLTSCQENASQATVTAVPVKLQVLETSSVADSSEFVGTLESAERVDLRPETQGRVAQVLVQPGDRVTPGTPILNIDPGQTVPQLQGAEAGLGIARAGQKASQDQFRSAQKGLEVARTELANAQASNKLAETNFERADFLVSQGAIGRFDYDRARTELDISRNRVQAAQQKVGQAQAAVSQAQAGVQQANESIRQAQAQVSSAQVNVGFTQVKAPIAGVVGDIFVKAGDVVSTSQTITNIVQNNALELRLSVPSNRLSQLRLGLPVELIDPTTRQRISTGQISFISPSVDTSAQVVLVKAQFANSDRRLQNGQYAEARIIWDRGTGVLIPTNAVLQVSGKSFAYVAESDDSQGEARQVARMRPVELGEIQDQSYQVLGGLKPGENLIVSGILRLRDGVPIQPES